MEARIFQYNLLEPRKLTPTEEVNYERVLELEQEIVGSGRWRVPVAAHRSDLFVMDGHHRLTVAKRLRLEVIPIVLLDYDTVDVMAWRDGETIVPEDIFKMARAKRKFPCKTTRHIFKNPLPICDIPLSDLQYPSLIQGMEAFGIWAKLSPTPC